MSDSQFSKSSDKKHEAKTFLENSDGTTQNESRFPFATTNEPPTEILIELQNPSFNGTRTEVVTNQTYSSSGSSIVVTTKKVFHLFGLFVFCFSLCLF
jgi:hypothetical protein